MILRLVLSFIFGIKTRIMNKLLTIITILIFTQTLPAQRLGGILGKAADRLNKQISDEVSDIAAEKLADYVVRKTTPYTDSLYREAYEQDSIEGNSRTYDEFLANMDKSKSIRDVYSFDIQVHFVQTDHKGRKNEGAYYFNSESTIYGMHMPENHTIAVFDLPQDLMISYDTENKTAYGLGNMAFIGKSVMALGGVDTEGPEWEFKATGEKKEIAGYDCIGYFGTNGKDEVEYFMTNDLPEYTYESMMNLMRHIGMHESFNLMSDADGMPLEYNSVHKKKKVSQTTTKITYDTIEIKKSDYNSNK